MEQLISWVLAGGALTAAASVVGMLINRRNVKSEANARDLKSPAEVDNLVATTHRANLESVLAVNAELRADNEGLRERLDKVETKQTEMGQVQTELGDLVNILQRGLASAYAYITTLLQLIEEHMPHIVVPPAPKGYRETTQQKETSR